MVYSIFMSICLIINAKKAKYILWTTTIVKTHQEYFGQKLSRRQFWRMHGLFNVLRRKKNSIKELSLSSNKTQFLRKCTYKKIWFKKISLKTKKFNFEVWRSKHTNWSLFLNSHINYPRLRSKITLALSCRMHFCLAQ